MQRKEIQRGDLFYYDFGKREGSVQSGERPVMVIQADNFNANAPTIIVAAVTAVMKKKYLPSHIILGEDFGLKKPSMVLLEQIQTVNKDELTDYITMTTVPREVSVVAILTSILRKLRLANAKFRCWISSKKHSLWKRKDRSCLIFIAKLLWTDILILSFLTVLDSRNIKQPLTKQYVVLSVTAMMNSS